MFPSPIETILSLGGGAKFNEYQLGHLTLWYM